MDAALIHFATYYRGVPYPSSRDFKPFIFENNSTPYYGIEKPDYNREVGITAYLRPDKIWENTTRAYKSGRTTGVTYGLIQKIDTKIWSYSDYGYVVIVDPALRISRCYTDEKGNYICYYRSNIARGGDSGGPVYIRHLIYAERIGNVYIYHYGAQMIGILAGISDDWPATILYASWAVLIKERWPDLELVTCGPDIGRCL